MLMTELSQTEQNRGEKYKTKQNTAVTKKTKQKTLFPRF